MLVIGPEAEVGQLERVSSDPPSATRPRPTGARSARGRRGRRDANLIEPLIDCARARCTEGEIVGTLCEAVFGEYRETPRF